jgi:hypothetical protein
VALLERSLFVKGELGPQECAKWTAPETPALRSTCAPSGRQDSNLRPLVPRTSTYFPMRCEFGLECFRRKMVGMTTRARVMESTGIAENPSALFDRDHRLFP